MVIPNNLLKSVGRLPDELIDIIYSYIPKIVTIFLTKKSYKEEHSLIKRYINNKNIENYIRTMIRQDNDFVLKHLLVENYNRWWDMKKYYYKSCIYTNYVAFLESYAIENESNKCRILIINFFEELGLRKNQHKKNIIRYIRWRT